MKTNMTIEELAQHVNEELEKQNSSEAKDGRYSSSISVRRIRDYINKGILENGLKQGREIIFNEDHAQKLLNLRKMQSEGLSDQYLKKVITSSEQPLIAQISNGDDVMQKQALEKLSTMLGATANLNSANYSHGIASLVAQSSLGLASNNLISKTQEIKKRISVYEPHPYVSLTIQDNVTFTEQEINQISQDIQTILRRQK